MSIVDKIIWNRKPLNMMNSIIFEIDIIRQMIAIYAGDAIRA